MATSLQGFSTVPLVAAGAQLTTGVWPAIAIGSNQLSPSSAQIGTFWFVVFDRTTLAVVANVFSGDSDNVPAAVQPYANNSQYLLVFLTWGVTINNVPQGALYNFLVAAGASSGLARLEQINLQLSCGLFGAMSYVLVSQLGTGSGGGQTLPGIEGTSLSQTDWLGAVVTAQLIPTVVGGVVYYTPVEVQD